MAAPIRIGTCSWADEALSKFWYPKGTPAGEPGMRFKMIGYVYLFYVWFVFFMTYLARVRGTFPNAGGTFAEHAVLMGIVILLLIVKIVQLARKDT